MALDVLLGKVLRLRGVPDRTKEALVVLEPVPRTQEISVGEVEKGFGVVVATAVAPIAGRQELIEIALEGPLTRRVEVGPSRPHREQAKPGRQISRLARMQSLELLQTPIAVSSVESLITGRDRIQERGLCPEGPCPAGRAWPDSKSWREWRRRPGWGLDGARA